MTAANHDNSRRGVIKAFDVDFAHCECKGTVHEAANMQVVSVKWKRTDNDPNGRVRFQCQRCKKSWSMGNVRSRGTGIVLYAAHPEEVKRRKRIHPEYDTYVAVNLSYPSPPQENDQRGGQVNLIGGTRKGVRSAHA